LTNKFENCMPVSTPTLCEPLFDHPKLSFRNRDTGLETSLLISV